MRVSNLVVERKDGTIQRQFSFSEGIFHANQQRKRIVNTNGQDWLLLETNEHEKYEYPARSETFICAAKGKQFGKFVEVPFKNPETGKEQLISSLIDRKYRDSNTNLLVMRQGFFGDRPLQYFTNSACKKIMGIDELNNADVLFLKGSVIQACRVKRAEKSEIFKYAGKPHVIFTSNEELIGSFIRLHLNLVGPYFLNCIYANGNPADRVWVPTYSVEAKV